MKFTLMNILKTIYYTLIVYFMLRSIQYLQDKEHFEISRIIKFTVFLAVVYFLLSKHKSVKKSLQSDVGMLMG